ncbi:MAG: type II secretion system F family protein, partial [Desulfurococcaceae archaeon]
MPLFKKKKEEKIEEKKEKESESKVEEKKLKKFTLRLSRRREEAVVKKAEEERVEEKPRVKKGFKLGFRLKKEKPVVEEAKPVEEKAEAEKKVERKPLIKISLKKEKKPVEKPVTEAKPPTPVLRVVRKREKKVQPPRERGILIREIYKSIAFLVIEGFIFGSLSAIVLYIGLTGFTNSPLVVQIADQLSLDVQTTFLIIVLPCGLGIGILASDLIFKSQRGLGLISVLSMKARRKPVEKTAMGRTLPLHPGRLSLAGISIVIPATGLLLIYMFPGIQIALTTGAILLGIGVVITLYLFVTAIKPAPPLPWYAALVTEIRTLKPEESTRLAELVRTAGIAASPSLIMSKYIAIAIMFSFLLIPVTVLIGFSIMFGLIELDIAMIIVGLLVIGIVTAMYYPYIKLSQLKNERKRLVERDLPFFAIYTSILQSAGLFIDNAFRRLIGHPLFPGIEREGRLLERDIKLGKDPLEALSSLALGHPSKKFKDFVFGYTSVVKSGWDALSYLSMRIKEYTQEMKFNWRVYSERTGGLGELLVTTFLMTTTLFVLIAVVLPYDVGTLMSLFNFLLLPLITVVMIQSMDALVPQPRIKDMYSINILLVGATPFIVLIALSMLELDPVLTLEATFISALLALGINYQIQHAEVKSIESALPEFLRDVTEYRKIGFPLLRAFFMIKETNRKYNKYFDRLLDIILAQLRAGIRLNRVRVPTRSWLGKFVFWLLGEIEDTGGGTPAVLEEFTSLITDLLDARETAKKGLRLYNILSYITPVFLLMFVAFGIMINNM